MIFDPNGKWQFSNLSWQEVTAGQLKQWRIILPPRMWLMTIFNLFTWDLICNSQLDFETSRYYFFVLIKSFNAYQIIKILKRFPRVMMKCRFYMLSWIAQVTRALCTQIAGPERLLKKQKYRKLWFRNVSIQNCDSHAMIIMKTKIKENVFLVS